MKIVGFEGNGGLRLGVVEGEEVIDLSAAMLLSMRADMERRNIA